MVKVVLSILLSFLLGACGGGAGGPPPPSFAPVPATACGVASVAATAQSSDVRFVDPVNLSGVGGLSLHPTIAVGPADLAALKDNVYVAWDDDGDVDGDGAGWGNKDIWFRKSTDQGANYSAALNVSRSGNATTSSIGVGRDGTAHVAWQDVKDGPSEIYYARLTDGGSAFGLAKRISDPNPFGDTATQASLVSLAVDSRSDDGNIYLVWEESNLMTQSFSLKLARSTNRGISFSVVYTYTPTRAEVSVVQPTLSVDAAGNLHLGWREAEMSSGSVVRTIRYAKSTDAGTTFSVPLTLATGTTLSYPSLATDPADSSRVYIAWRNEDDSAVHFAASSDGGASFGAERALAADSDPLTLSTSPRLAVGPDSTLYLAWTDNRGGNYDTVYLKSTDHGATFSDPVNFAPSAQGSLFTAIAVNGESNVYIAWDDDRYSTPVGTPEIIGSEGNFEILVARGKLGLPAVQAASVSPCPLTPNGDGKADTTTFSASSSEPIDWVLDVLSPDGGTVLQQTGTGSTISVNWDGRNGGQLVPDGTYTYRVRGSTVAGLVATQANGSLEINTTAADAAPDILSFSREAFGFSPNGDGFKDSDGISAKFNKPLNWTLSIKDGSTVKRTLTGSGINIDGEVTRWDGKDDAGNALPDGNYTVALSVIDGNGKTDACGALPIACLNMEIDTARPDVPDAAVDQADYDPDTDNNGVGDSLLVISGTPADTALVTIDVYNSANVQVKKVDRAFHDGGATFNVTWDGTDNNNQLATAGSYVIKMWCRDRAGNTAAIYPRVLSVSVR